MRKIDIIVLMSLVLCLYSCTGDKIPTGIEFGKAPARSLNTGTTSLSFGDYSSSQNVSISANFDWTAECSDSWVTATKNSSTELQVSVSDNYSDERNTTIYLKQQGKSEYLATISVRQKADLSNPTETFKVSGVSFKMIRVKGGTFIMGATSEQGIDVDDGEKPTHPVTLDTYFIGETEVTQELWEAVMGYNPSYFIDPMRPVECVSWDDCQTFIMKLNEKTGEKFRLPTEAEWEYAARGRKSEGFKYAGSNNIDEVAWYDVNSFDVDSSSSEFGTYNVGTKKANELGLYDMSGNVWEWCQDWYGSYSSNSQTNPTGASSGSNRVLRGGGWFFYAWDCRVSSRYGHTPGSSFHVLGLRLAL